MIALNRNFRDLLKCLNSAGVRYLVLGGYAVNFHGYHRNTKDLDFWIATDKENAGRVSAALQQFGFAAKSVPAALFQKLGQTYTFGRDPFTFDLLTKPSGVTFESCYARRVEATIEGVVIPFVSVADLLMNKRASARAKDLADIETLSSVESDRDSKRTKSRRSRAGQKRGKRTRRSSE